MCSALIGTGTSCFLDNWVNIASVLQHVISISIVFGIIFGIILLLGKSN